MRHGLIWCRIVVEGWSERGAADAWRRPNSNVEGPFSSDFAVDLARRAEAAHLDFVFRPDVSFLPMEMPETGSGFASLDPTVLLASVARETSRIGLVSTISTTFFPPCAVARQLQSLRWISNGRAGWVGRVCVSPS